MKILHLIDSFDARFDRDQTKLVEFLECRGHHNTVVTSKFSSDWRIIRAADFKNWERKFHQAEIMHMASLRIPTPLSKSLSPIYLPSRQFLHSFDIVHAYTFNTYSSFVGAALKRIKNAKLVARSDLSQATYSKARNIPFYRTIVTYPFRIADAVYTYSNLEKHLLVNLGVKENRIWIIPAGIDFDKFSKLPIGQRRARITIGYLGRFCFVKGIHRAVSALQRLLREEKVRVIFTGIIESVEYAKTVMDPLKKFVNFQYHSDLSTSPIDFYNMCDVVLIPSISETGAITVLEAMASGRAVIASNINPINDYIEHGRTGFLINEENDVYAFTKKLIEDPCQVTEFGERARKAAEKYDWRHLVRRYEAMYQSVLE